MVIRDLVEVPSVRTVVRLADVLDPALRKGLVESFVVTDEVEHALGTVLGSLASGVGKGFFVEGNFGSGKSHLLAMLRMLLEDPATSAGFACNIGALSEIAFRRYLVVSISLVDHGSREYLEDIVMDEIEPLLRGGHGSDALDVRASDAKELATFLAEIGARLEARYPVELAEFVAERGLGASDELFRPARAADVEAFLRQVGAPYRLRVSRRETFARLSSRLRDQGLDGMVILIDELSEFLKVRPGSRAFNEDIRFLQFLAERGSEIPCWVVATLQERLEATGDVPPEAFGKTKDRYPVRLRLTGTHIKEIIEKRLVRKKEGADYHIRQIYADLREAFGDVGFGPDEFVGMYPVHPAAVNLLDELKPLFSQHRGVIDFIHSQLAGDPDRRIPGMIDMPSDTLLGADRIFDHFRDRIREVPELSGYSEKVYRYYEAELPSLVPDKGERRLAEKLVKILILQAISPLSRKVTVSDLARLALERVTTLESSVNYGLVADVLARLHRSGSYIACEAAKDPLETRYYVDLAADAGVEVQRKAAYIKSGLFPGDSRLLTMLAPDVDPAHLPLETLIAGPKCESTRHVAWQRTSREALVAVLRFDEISPDRLAGWADRLLTAETDFVLVIGWPQETSEQIRHLESVIVPELARLGVADAFVFWAPEGLDAPGRERDLDALLEVLARRLLCEEISREGTSSAAAVRSYLEALLEQDRLRVRELYRELYSRGSLISGRGDTVLDLSEGGAGSFEQALDRAGAAALTRRFPAHMEVAPRSEALTPGVLQRCITDFLGPGAGIEPVKIADHAVASAVEGFFCPMGLARRTARGYSVTVDAGSNPLVAAALASVREEKASFRDVYLGLRKGPYGLARDSFQVLLTTLVCTGLVSAYMGGRKMAPGALKSFNFWKVDAFGRGEALAPELQDAVSEVGMIPSRLRKGSATIARQQEIWDFLGQWKREAEALATTTKSRLAELRDYQALGFLDFDGALREADEVARVAAEVKTSYSSQEGIERFLHAYRTSPYFERYYGRVVRLGQFLGADLDRFLAIFGYLTSSHLVIPRDMRFSELEQRRRELISLASDEECIFDAGRWQRLVDGFEEFQENYIRVYLEEHSRMLGQARFAGYDRLESSRAFGLLRQLSKVQFIAVKDDMVRVERALAAVRARRCDGPAERMLKVSPVCGCGFHLGDEVSLTPVDRIAEMVESGVREYLAGLRSAEHMEKIRGHVAGLEAVGKRHIAEPVRCLLAMDPAAPGLVEEMADIVTPSAMEAVSQALSGRVLMVDRDVDELYERIVGRTFPLEKVMEVFREWLEGPSEVAPGTYVRITEGRRLPACDGFSEGAGNASSEGGDAPVTGAG